MVELVLVPIPTTDHLTTDVALLLREGDKLVFCKHLEDSICSPTKISIGQLVIFKEPSKSDLGRRIRLVGFMNKSSYWNFPIECFKVFDTDLLTINQIKTTENGKQNSGKVIEVQRITPSIRREETRGRCAVSGKGGKTTIRVGHPGYRKTVGY